MFSILFRNGGSAAETSRDEPSCFHDLNLDRVIGTVTAAKGEYDLKPFFYTLLPDADDVLYRHEVFKDLEKKPLFSAVKSFEAKMRGMRHHLALADKLDYRHEKERWFLKAVEDYCGAVSGLARDITAARVSSRGFSALRRYVSDYVQTEGFRSLRTDAEKLKNDLSAVRYCLLIDGTSVKVRRYASEEDYASEVEKTFAKFRRNPQKTYLVDFQTSINLNHVEAMALECVARLFPDIFARLDEFFERNRDFADPTIVAFDREVQFFVSYLEFTAPLRRAGIEFCYPFVSPHRKDVFCRRGVDIALADAMGSESADIVRNDFRLENEERVIVVTGPNQGGKTTFARMFGQLHVLAGVGCPVPAAEAGLLLADGIYTHFGKEEDLSELRGKLEDDLLRIHAILSRSTARSVVIMNEIFTSTTVQDALFLSGRILDHVFAKDSLAVLVTFLDELAEYGKRTVSMVAEVDPRDPMVRTFKVSRAPADGLAYALTLAAKHRLTYESIKVRVRP